MASSSGASRVLLEGDILHIGFHGVGKAPYPEDIVPAAVMRALGQQQRIDLGTEGIFWGDYCYFAGVTGEAFRFLEFMGLSPREPGVPLVQAYGHMGVADMYARALDAAGLRAEVHLKPRLPEKARLRGLVVESLRDRRTPVIGLGVFGPPEPFLITGYDRDGDVLLGWSHLQGEKKGDPRISFEASGEFRLSDWYEAIEGVAVVTATKRRPEPRAIYRAAIEIGILELETTGSAELGTAGMEKWAALLERDAASIARYSDHSGTAGDLAERRALAGSFMELACRVLPEAASDLTGAQAAFSSSHDTVYEIWETVAKSGPFDHDESKFRDPGRRKTLAALVRRLAVLDRRAVVFLRRALAAPEPDPILDGTAILAKAPQPPAAEPIWAPENIHLPNAMGMLRQFLGESFGDLNEAERSNRKLDYCMWMGISGAAFGMLWDGPERLNIALAFDALGYDYELWMSGKLAKETGVPCRVWGWDDNLRRRILWNLRDRRLPVLLFGCGAWPDWWLVTRVERGCLFQGYGGSSGEHYRPNEPLDHPKNPLRKIKLMEEMKGEQTWTINVIAKRSSPRLPLDELYRRAVAWGADAMRRRKMRVLDASGAERLSDTPYRDWASMLRNDSLFPPGDAAELERRRDQLEGHEVELAERRHYGAGFLELAAVRLGREEIKEAARHFRAVGSLMERVWGALGGFHAPQAHLKLADPQVREMIAGLLMEMEKADEAASGLLAAK